MRSPLPAFQAFAHDARARSAEAADLDERMSGFLAVAKSAERLSTMARAQRAEFAAALAEILPPSDARPSLTHDVQPAPVEWLARMAERFRVEAEHMERSGCFELAFTTMSAVCQFTARSDLTTRMLATVHLGRVARQLGDLESATDCYQTAADESLRERDGPLAARGLIGLGVIAHTRGNRPAERKLFERALSLAAPGGGADMAASQGLMLSALEERRLTDALRHGWRAYDLTAPGSEDRAMILSSIATASLHGDFSAAALRGFLHVLTLTDTARIRLTSIGGAIRAAARLRDGVQVQSLEQSGELESQRARIPFETARFHMFAAEAWAMMGDRDFARRRLQDAIAVATVHGFFELKVRSEDALDALEHEAQVVPQANRTTEYLSDYAGDAEVVRDGIGRLEALGV